MSIQQGRSSRVCSFFLFLFFFFNVKVTSPIQVTDSGHYFTSIQRHSLFLFSFCAVICDSYLESYVLDIEVDDDNLKTILKPALRILFQNNSNKSNHNEKFGINYKSSQSKILSNFFFIIVIG